MNKHRRYPILLLGLILVFASSVAACAEEPEIGLKIGDSAPDFTLQTIDNDSITLSALRGKLVMVNLWLIGCKGCVEEMSHIQVVFDKWSQQELAIVAINTADDAEAVKEFADSQGLTFPILLDPQGQVRDNYGRFGVPMTFFIDDKGIVKNIKHSAFLSPDEIESILESL